jgi:hypothetical protein
VQRGAGLLLLALAAPDRRDLLGHGDTLPNAKVRVALI